MTLDVMAVATMAGKSSITAELGLIARFARAGNPAPAFVPVAIRSTTALMNSTEMAGQRVTVELLKLESPMYNCTVAAGITYTRPKVCPHSEQAKGRSLVWVRMWR